MKTATAPPVSRRLHDYLAAQRRRINRALRQCLPRAGAYPPVIHRAMRYSVLGGGKRLRATLCLAACEAVGGRMEEALPAACALECIHAYSLIHDDLPAMDNAATRRGQPSCHRRYGEAVAILAGDALLSLGFELIARGNHAPRRLRAIEDVARIAGTEGLIGGQVMDLAWQQGTGHRAQGTGYRMKKQSKTSYALAMNHGPCAMRQTRRLLEYINANKTAKLMSVSAKIGARLGGGTASQVRAFEHYGFELGIAFQLTDDLLDREGMAVVVGEDTARALAGSATQRAKQQLAGHGCAADLLCELADSIVWRTA